MAEVRRANIVRRLGAKAMRSMSKVLLGYDPVFIEEMLNMMGSSGVRVWGERLQDTMNQLDERFGHHEAQHIVSFAAMLNGCPFCSIGHMYAGNLYLFAEDENSLYPIDERDVLSLQELPDEQLMAEFTKRLQGTPFAPTLAHYERLYALKFGGAQAESREDELFLAAIGVWDLLTECTILSEGIEPANIDPLAEIAKDRRLIERYHAARGR